MDTFSKENTPNEYNKKSINNDSIISKVIGSFSNSINAITPGFNSMESIHNELNKMFSQSTSTSNIFSEISQSISDPKDRKIAEASADKLSAINENIKNLVDTFNDRGELSEDDAKEMVSSMEKMSEIIRYMPASVKDATATISASTITNSLKEFVNKDVDINVQKEAALETVKLLEKNSVLSEKQSTMLYTSIERSRTQPQLEQIITKMSFDSIGNKTMRLSLSDMTENLDQLTASGAEIRTTLDSKTKFGRLSEAFKGRAGEISAGSAGKGLSKTLIGMTGPIGAMTDQMFGISERIGNVTEEFGIQAQKSIAAKFKGFSFGNLLGKKDKTKDINEPKSQQPEQLALPAPIEPQIEVKELGTNLSKSLEPLHLLEDTSDRNATSIIESYSEGISTLHEEPKDRTTLKKESKFFNKNILGSLADLSDITIAESSRVVLAQEKLGKAILNKFSNDPVVEDQAKDIAEFTKHATTKGSIYTHDIHAEANHVDLLDGQRDLNKGLLSKFKMFFNETMFGFNLTMKSMRNSLGNVSEDISDSMSKYFYDQKIRDKGFLKGMEDTVEDGMSGGMLGKAGGMLDAADNISDLKRNRKGSKSRKGKTKLKKGGILTKFKDVGTKVGTKISKVPVLGGVAQVAGRVGAMAGSSIVGSSAMAGTLISSLSGIAVAAAPIAAGLAIAGVAIYGAVKGVRQAGELF